MNMPEGMYANNFGYCKAPVTRDLNDPNIDTFIMGVPFDIATSGRPGARQGPAAIRQISGNLSWEAYRYPWRFNLSKRMTVADYGDLEQAIGEPGPYVEDIQMTAGKILDAGKHLVTLGGDHFITLPLLRAYAERFGPVSLIHFDAHTDDEEEDIPVYHGNMFYLAQKEGIIDPEHSVQVGIRTEYYSDSPFTVLDAGWVNDTPVEQVLEKIISTVGDRPAYLTFDIDCLDPAFAPGTGTPVIGGLSSDRALKLIRGLSACNIIGMDLVEVAPAYDHSDITALAGATLVLEYLYMQASKT